MRIETRGRKKLKADQRRKFIGITVDPELADELSRIERDKSGFIEAILSNAPIQKWIDEYNKNPKKFLHNFVPFGI